MTCFWGHPVGTTTTSRLSRNSLKFCVIMCVIYSGGLYSEIRTKLLSCAVPAPAGRGDFQQITFYIIVRTSQTRHDNTNWHAATKCSECA